MAEDPERDDPVLVRPYITTQAAGSPAAPDEPAAQTWPAAADLPEDGTREIAAVPAPVAATPDPATKSTALRRQRLLVLAGIGVLALLGGAGLLLFMPSGDEETPPATALPAPAAPSVLSSAGAAPVASAGTLSATPSSRGGSRSAAASRTANSPVPAAPGQPAATTTTTPPPAGRPAETLSPPPDPARTGPVAAGGGRCLNLAALFPTDGARIQTAGCSDINYQRWTMASDGTLQVAGKCARVADAAEIRLGGCDDQPAAQWRAGPNGSLVNPDTGRCLTDPGETGKTVTVASCTGAANQRWTLP